MTNKEVAHLLRSIAAAHQIRNVNRFRIIAYENAADTVEHLTREIKDIWQDGKLDKVPGIGKTIGDALDEFFRKGRSKHFDQALKGIPETVFELMRVPSLGPKKAYKLVKTLHLSTKETVIEDLKNYALMGKIAKIPSFGKRSQDLILKSLELYQSKRKDDHRMPLPYAYSLAQEMITYLKKDPNVKGVDALGSLRRMVATIGDVDLAVKANIGSKEIVKHFINYPKKVSVDNSGEKKASIIVSRGIRVDLRVQEEEGYGAMLQYFTGSKAHNIRLREYAQRRGLSLSEYGIKDVKRNKLYKFKTEEEFYKFLRLQYIPPEIREDAGEIELAKKNKIPRLIEMSDIKGDLHIHSNYDLKPSHDFGENSYSEILNKAKEFKYEYIGFSDHNPKTGDLSPEQIVAILKKRKEQIEKTVKIKDCKYFIGLEVDILSNGSLPLSDEALKYLDYVIVSVHSSFGQDIKTMTKRVLNALSYPKVKILGHPTGRLLQRREGIELDWNTVFAECKKRNIAVEINAWPERLDLPDILVREAKKAGVKFVINTDAHANWHMDNMFYGVAVARRGWLTKADVLNTMSYSQFKDWLLRS